MCNVAFAVTVTMDRSLGWQCSVPVKVSVTLSCVVIVMGVRAEAAPAAANGKAAANASAQSTIFLRCKARSMRLSFPFVCALSLCAQSTIREEGSQSHGSRVLFWSGNCVVASPYEAAYFECFQERPTSQLRRTPLRRSSENYPSTHSGE